MHQWDAQDLSWMHLLSPARIKALVSESQRVEYQKKKYVQKSHTLQETTALKVQNSRIKRQATTNMGVCICECIWRFVAFDATLR